MPGPGNRGIILYTCIYIYIYVCKCIDVCIYMYIYIYMCVCIHTCIYVCIYMYTCMYVYSKSVCVSVHSFFLFLRYTRHGYSKCYRTCKSDMFEVKMLRPYWSSMFHNEHLRFTWIRAFRSPYCSDFESVWLCWLQAAASSSACANSEAGASEICSSCSMPCWFDYACLSTYLYSCRWPSTAVR